MATPDHLLAEQLAYYRAIAGEYAHHTIPAAGADEVMAAFEDFRPAGHVLELACGPGFWTERLARYATSLTAVDGSPEMIARARERVGAGVRFVEADLFRWRPERRYDAVFFGFWLSHVPMDRFDGFWDGVADGLAPDGRVFFVDDHHRTDEELIEGPDSATVERRLRDGTPFRAIKVPHEAAALAARLRGLGWDIDVFQTAGSFYWGAGGRS